MNKDYTHSIIILDESGSMSPIVDDTLGGLTEFIARQEEQQGQCTLTVVTFGYQSKVLRDFVPIQECEPITKQEYHPMGGTALLDTVMKTAMEQLAIITALPQEEQPTIVNMVIVTDGEENSSRKYTLKDVQDLITKLKEEYNWLIIYLGVGLETFKDTRFQNAKDIYSNSIGTSLNIESRLSNSVSKTPGGIKNAWSTTSQVLNRTRTASFTGTDIREAIKEAGYTEDETFSLTEQDEE